MSYARRLVQMTRSTAPAERPVVREEVAQAEVGGPLAAAPPSTTPAAQSMPPHQPQTRAAAAPAPREAEPTTIERIVTEAPRERTRVVEKLVAASAPPAAQLPPAAPAAVTHREVVHEWLAERNDRADPLDSISSDDEMRELLRAVRGWTSSAPVAPERIEDVITVEIPAAEPPRAVQAPQPVQVAAPPAADPVQVSIGNVVITIEDAPAAPARPSRPAAMAPDLEGRLSRHYWRER